MTYEEILASLTNLTKEQREELMIYLKAVAQFDDPEYRAEMARQRREVEAGNFTSDAEVKRLLAVREKDAA